MTIPDQLVYASVSTMAGIAVWAARQFVVSVRHNNTKDDRPLTVRAYRELADLLKDDLGSHFMSAPEARTHFLNLSAKIDSVTEELHVYMAQQGGQQARAFRD